MVRPLIKKRSRNSRCYGMSTATKARPFDLPYLECIAITHVLPITNMQHRTINTSPTILTLELYEQEIARNTCGHLMNCSVINQ
jgi:hypothetical protein